MLRLNVLEIFLLQLVFYGLLWLWDQYVASYVCIIMPIVIAAILLVSWIADLIEPSRVGRKYYLTMMVSVVAPVVVGAFFYYIHEGALAWMQPVTG
jgi:hypothetical protein